jgi:hypothetical protein
VTPTDEQVCAEMREAGECGHNGCHNYCHSCMTVIPREAGNALCHACDPDLQAGSRGMSDSEVRAAYPRAQRMAELMAAGYSRQEAKSLTFFMMATPMGMAQPRCPVTGTEIVRDQKHFGEPVVVPYVGIGRVIEPPLAPEKPLTARVYDPRKVVATFNGIEFEGFIDGTFIEVERAQPRSVGARELPDVKFTARVPCFVRTWTIKIPKRLLRKWRRKKRMKLRRRRGRGACSA